MVTGTSGNIAVAAYTKDYSSGLPSVGNTVAIAKEPRFDSQGNVISSDLYQVVKAPGSEALSVFVPNSNDTDYEIDFGSLFNSGLKIPADLNGVGVSMACSGCDEFVTIQFDASASDTKLYVGKSSNKNPKPICYVVGVANVTDEKSLTEAIFNGISHEASAVTGAMGTSLPSSTDVSTPAFDLNGNWSAHNIRFNYFAATGKLTLTKSGPSVTLMNGISGRMVTDYGYKPEQKKKIQASDKGSQNTTVFLPNTTLSILFPDPDDFWDIDPEESDYPSEYSSDYSNAKTEADKRDQWRKTEWRYPARKFKLDRTNFLSTRQHANRFMDDVDQALKYLLYSNTTLGAESQRMEISQKNLVIAGSVK